MPAYDLRPERQIGSDRPDVRRIRQLCRGVLPDDRRAWSTRAGASSCSKDPGQGSALEDYGLHDDLRMGKTGGRCSGPLSGSKDVAAVGISLGGGLVIRAAAFEPRIGRAVAFDILDDEFEVIARQIGRGVRIPLRALLNLRARWCVNAIAGRAAARKPVSEWGLQQGMHITGTATPYHPPACHNNSEHP